MRKHIREIMRHEAEKHHYRPSKAVHELWTRYQNKKVGPDQRRKNQAIGTHKKKTWRMRIAMQVGK